ncbi:HK97 family phage prohead protease [Planomicrobium chinense]|uniref:HK97 family phage prohead protease n=1 Tax=Planococcus chinensis TaxID=272917 RepID=UPI001CC53EDE|nr:HK97 family phage prohead protease [Planococcus chinensis]MBZ5203204.1 HK97 family phage prohead protease [Planococcus chinensis]
MSEIEKRYLDSVEVRAADDTEKRIVSGYALRFNTWSNNLGGFIETIDPAALDDADMTDVRALYEHSPQMILGRTKAGTLKLEKDEVGLRFECELPDTTYARDLYENIRNGNISQCSFGFKLEKGGDSLRFDSQDKLYRRTLKKIKSIFDVSIVAYPAYSDTDVAPALRSIQQTEELADLQKAREKEAEKLKIELELL